MRTLVQIYGTWRIYEGENGFWGECSFFIRPLRTGNHASIEAVQGEIDALNEAE